MGIFDSINEEDSDAATATISAKMMEAMLKYMPLRGILSFGSGKTVEEFDQIIERLNKEVSNN
jgi:beta-glucosidase